MAVGRRRFSLSVPEDLADWLEGEAANQGRTRNNLIVWILEQHWKMHRTSKRMDTES
jgi:metal-responsive CopG/Arc/MetJ family transcriptional regulator